MPVAPPEDLGKWALAVALPLALAAGLVSALTKKPADVGTGIMVAATVAYVTMTYYLLAATAKQAQLAGTAARQANENAIRARLDERGPRAVVRWMDYKVMLEDRRRVDPVLVVEPDSDAWVPQHAATDYTLIMQGTFVVSNHGPDPIRVFLLDPTIGDCDTERQTPLPPAGQSQFNWEHVFSGGDVAAWLDRGGWPGTDPPSWTATWRWSAENLEGTVADTLTVSASLSVLEHVAGGYRLRYLRPEFLGHYGQNARACPGLHGPPGGG